MWCFKAFFILEMAIGVIFDLYPSLDPGVACASDNEIGKQNLTDFYPRCLVPC